MNESINLLNSKRKPFRDKRKIVHYVRIVSGIFLFAIAAASLSLFVIKVSSPFPDLQKEEGAALSKLRFLETKALKQLYVKNKLRDIKNIQLTRSDYVVLIDIINKTKPEDVDLKTVEIQKKSIDLSLTSPSLTSINTYLLYLSDLSKTKKVFSRVMLDGISVVPAARAYSLSIHISLL